MELTIIDRVGNQIKEGDTILWMVPGTEGLLAAIAKIDAGGVVTLIKGKRGVETAGGKLVLQVVLGVPDSEGKPLKYADFIKTFDPSSQKILEAILNQ